MKQISEVEKYQIQHNKYDCDYIVDSTKKHCVIFSNCHGVVISELLRSVPEFTDIYNIYVILGYLYTKDEYNCPLTNTAKTSITNLLKICDVFMFQKCYRNHDFLSTYEENENSLQHLCKKSCKYVVLTNPQNTGLWSLHFPKNTKNTTIEEEFQKSCAKFLMKDKMSDTPVYNYFINNYRNVRLFIDRAHPSIYLFIEIVKKILEKLNIQHYKIFCVNNLNPCYLLGGFPHSIQDVNIHKLTYVEDSEVKNANNITTEC
jgi:hypothetical protein